MNTYPNNFNYGGQQPQNQGQVTFRNRGNNMPQQWNQHGLQQNQLASVNYQMSMAQVNQNINTIVNNVNAMNQYVNRQNTNMSNSNSNIPYNHNNNRNYPQQYAQNCRRQVQPQQQQQQINHHQQQQQQQRPQPQQSPRQNNNFYNSPPQSPMPRFSAKAIAALSAPDPASSNRNYDSQKTTKLKGALRWIIYSDQIDDYAEMLCTTIDLKIFVINQCSKHSKTQSACIRWSKAWNLTDNPMCSHAVLYSMAHSKQNAADRHRRQHTEQKGQIIGFDDLPHCDMKNLDAEVIFVDDKASFDEAAKILLAEKVCIGLDMECLVKQFSSTPKRKTCQILQVSTSTKVVLFDLEALPPKYGKKKKASTADGNGNGNGKEPISHEEFDKLMHGILYDPAIVKVGMSFFGDIKLLHTAYPYLKCFKCIVKGYFELNTLLAFMRSTRGKKVFNIDAATERRIKLKLKSSNVKREGGLATIVRHVIKQRLIKKEQLSNWATRPLRLSQLKYAALDAKVEVDIYKALMEKHSKLVVANKWVADLCRF